MNKSKNVSNPNQQQFNGYQQQNDELINKSNQEIYNRIKPICKKLTIALLNEKPDDVPLFMLTWLRQYAGVENKKLSQSEMEELTKLKEQLMTYKQMEEEKAKKK